MSKQSPKSLKDFKSSLKSCKLFTDATGELPQFLNTNLVDQARTIKIFTGDGQAYIKIFYFQFFKLCFESEDVDYDTKINKFIEMLEKNQQMVKVSAKFGYAPTSNAILKDIVFEFLELLSECKQLVESTLAKYPAICDILTNFLCSYLTKYHNIPSSEYNTKKSIQILSQQLEVDIVQYDDCIQFTDSQIYLYKDNEDQIYMIYIDENKAVRNTKMGVTQEFNTSGFMKNSNKSIQPSNCEIITFDAPDLVFNETSNMYEDQSKMKMSRQVETASTFRKTRDSILKENVIVPTVAASNINYKGSELSKLFTNYEKQNDKKSLNRTKQFTDTFILDTIVSQPYRSKIKQIKQLARRERKARQPFFP